MNSSGLPVDYSQLELLFSHLDQDALAGETKYFQKLDAERSHFRTEMAADLRKQAAHEKAMVRAYHSVVDRARADTTRTKQRFAHMESDLRQRQVMLQQSASRLRTVLARADLVDKHPPQDQEYVDKLLRDVGRYQVA